MTIPEIRRATGLDHHREIARRRIPGAWRDDDARIEQSDLVQSHSVRGQRRITAAATLPPRQAAVKLGRSLNAVYLYRSAARIARRPHET